MPGDKSLETQQYYGHPGNHFWKILFHILGEPFSKNYTERVDLLLRHRIALWDVLSHCECEGSSDSNIKNEVVNDFSAFYKEYPRIRTVCFDSVQAEKFYIKHVGKNPDMKYIRVPSPSGANAWKSLADKMSEWSEILNYL